MTNLNKVLMTIFVIFVAGHCCFPPQLTGNIILFIVDRKD